MTMQTSSTPMEYDVEVWYEKPTNYRVALTSKQRGITQIILRNNEGVFVLTPHLKKASVSKADGRKTMGRCISTKRSPAALSTIPSVK